MPPFGERLQTLPHLGLGVSTEYGAGDLPGALDPLEARAMGHAAFLEVGVEVSKGLDRTAQAWVQAGLPATWHFLDLNLDDPADLDGPWLAAVKALLPVVRPAWMCGDAGLWHFGARDRGSMLLLPPVLTDDGARALADGVVRLREATGLEVLPENPPGTAFLGDLHLLDFFARVAHRADTGLLLDCAHLAVFQRIRGLPPLTGLDGFPLERVVEVHVAGGTLKDHEGFAWVDDDHGLSVLDDTWAIVEHVLPRSPNLRAVVVECERNPLAACLPVLERVRRAWPR